MQSILFHSLAAFATGACVLTVPTGKLQWPVSFSSAQTALTGGQMAFDETRMIICNSMWGQFDTWSWDGVTWTLLAPPQSPSSGREHFAIASDSVRQRIVLYGGFVSATQTRLSDTWEWDGETWTLREQCWAFGPGQGHGMVSD